MKSLFSSLLVLALISCGTQINNPSGPPESNISIPLGSPGSGVSADEAGITFDDVIADYESRSTKNCGRFDKDSSAAELEAGRQCVHNAFAACSEVRFLLDDVVSANARFTSSVSTRPSLTNAEVCYIQVFLVSTDTTRFDGASLTACTSLGGDENPELACGLSE